MTTATAQVIAALRRRADIVESWIDPEPARSLGGLSTESLRPYINNLIRTAVAAEFRKLADEVERTERHDDGNSNR